MSRLLDSLLAQGFDESYEREDGDGCKVRCSQCEALCVNGIACHEHGCPNIVRDEPENDEDYCDGDD